MGRDAEQPRLQQSHQCIVRQGHLRRGMLVGCDSVDSCSQSASWNLFSEHHLHFLVHWIEIFDGTETCELPVLVKFDNATGGELLFVYPSSLIVGFVQGTWYPPLSIRLIV